MGSGAFGWLAFGWYHPLLEDQGEVPEELVGVGGSITDGPRPGGSVAGLRPAGYVSGSRPGGSVKMKP